MATLDVNSPATQTHIAALQGIITRMASNSANAKTWCITLVSALLVALATRSKPDKLYLIALVPTIAFLLLDSEYLLLERHFRKQYDDFLSHLRNGGITDRNVFTITAAIPPGTRFVEAIKAIGSFAVWPFYLVITASVIFAAFWL